MTVKELQAQIDWIKTRSRNWIIAAIIALVLVIGLLIAVFRHKDDNPKIDALQQQLETEKAKVEILESKLPLYDSLLSNQQRQLDQNRTTETIIKHHYDKIYVDVPKLNNNQLRDEITNY